MSERRQGPDEDRLPLPSPHSPRQLDDKILAYARDKAPEKKPFMQPRWVVGLATAGVVVVALFITEPQQQMPQFRELTPTLEENMPSDAASAEKAKRKPTAPTMRMKMSLGTGQAAAIDKYEMHADEPLPEREIAEGAMAAAVEADKDLVSSAVAPLELSATDLELITLTTEELSDKLQRYADMVEKGEDVQARAAYQQLRHSCPDCDLSDTLAQALAILRGSEPPAATIKK
jgi:hypothetical protein